MELSMDVVEKSRESKYKLLIIISKFIPMLTALCYMISTIFNCFDYNIEPLSNLGGMSLLTWIFIYLASVVFKFCSYHRMFLWYILVDDLVNIVDYYWNIPISIDNILMLHNIWIGVTLFIVLILYVKDNKRITGEGDK